MSKRINRLTKVVATLGPASQDRLDEMIEAGVNVFRLNFSHKSAKENRDQLVLLINKIRDTADKLGKPVAIMGDLQGPKFRIGELKDHTAITIHKGDKIKFSVGTAIGDNSHIYTKNAPVIQGLSVGHRILLDDGTLEMKVTERYDTNNIMCEVVVGGKLGERKGINVPDIIVSSKLSEKDKEDSVFAVEQGLDYICSSFVQTADDVLELRAHMLAHAKDNKIKSNPSHIQKHVSWAMSLPLIISKIEKPQAVENIQAILEATDGIMVARGDLGVEVSLERVPAIQKMLIEASNHLQKPVITATQMLQTMIELPVPTRAEVSDVANAVFDGSDCVMLSAESAAGAYPIESVQTMVRIIEEAEKDLATSAQRRRIAVFLEMQQALTHAASEVPVGLHQTIAQSAVTTARHGKCCAIIVLSYSGLMAMRVCKYKPDMPVIALTPSKVAYRRMALLGYVYPIMFNVRDTVDETFEAMEEAVLKVGYLAKGDAVVLCAGVLEGLPGLTNTIKLYNFGELKK